MIKIYNKSAQDNNHKLEIDFTWFKFPGGELHFNITNPLQVDNALHIETDLANSDEIMLLMLVADTFRHRDKYLELLYTPYARQDRRTSHGEPFSLRAFAKMINSCGFKRVTVYDPHSDVTPALIDNIFVKKRLDIIRGLITTNLPSLLLSENTVIVSPDAGALKTNNEIAQCYKLPHISATKIRDTQTGEITHTEVHTNLDLKDKNLIILDDICDGGRTFIELAKVLKEYEPASIHLYVTVGIFSKGLEVLLPHFTSINYHHKLGT